MQQSIHFIANNENILPALRRYIEAQGFNFLEFPVMEAPPVEYLLIVEPFRIGSELYSISTTWKPWLMEFMPKTRLIVAAFSNSPHTNCLNLLDLPNNFQTWLDKALPVSAFPLIEVEDRHDREHSKYTDPWSFDLAKPANDLNLQMRKFVLGHEESKSLFSQVSAMRKPLQDMAYYKKEIAQEEHRKKWEEAKNLCSSQWHYFSHRWGYYSKVFDWVPYQGAIKKIRDNVNSFHKSMEKAGNPNHTPEISPLNAMIETINKDMLPYIFPEKYW